MYEKRYISPHCAIQYYFPHVLLSTSMEARSRDLHPETQEGPIVSFSCLAISLLDTIVKVFEKILSASIPSEVSGPGLLRKQQFCFRPKHSTSLQPACLFESPET